ncbi:MAG: 6-pyruvoyl-tetrahydropterin synthase-related protein, partial [Dehalococcoidia bacterium]
MLGGYGLPLFNFFPPFSYFLPALIQRLGSSLVASYNLAMAAGILLSGLTMYVLVRSRLGEMAAAVSAVAYMYSPYMLFQSFHRGNLGETLGLALFPLMLWASIRLTCTHNLRYLVVAALTYAALVLSHHVTAALLSPLVVLTWGGLLVRRNGSWRALQLNVAAVLLGLGLSSFFWIPVLMDSRWIQTDRISLTVELLTPWRLLTGAPPRDLGLMNTNPVGIGAVQTLLVIVAVVGLGRIRDRTTRWQTGLYLAGAGLYALLLLPLARPLWTHLSFLTILQWTYRLMA